MVAELAADVLLAATVVDEEWAAHGYADAKRVIATRAREAMNFILNECGSVAKEGDAASARMKR